jgi:hypothetical protein
MANVFVVPSLVPENLKDKILIKAVDPCDIAKMVSSYREKIKKNGEERNPPLKPEHKIDADNEYLALVISRSSLEVVLSQNRCVDLVALLSVEPGKNRNTIILMGLDEHGDLLRDDTGEFGQAEETWPVKLSVNVNDLEFNRFFKRTGAPCP